MAALDFPASPYDGQPYTANGKFWTYSSALSSWLGSVGPGFVPINPQTGTAYTLVLGDVGFCVEMANASANTVTIPPNASVAFPIGAMLLVRQTGAGITTIVAGSGVTITKPYTLAIGAQYGTCYLHKVATNTWRVGGELT